MCFSVVFAVNHKVPDISFPVVDPFSIELVCMLFIVTLFYTCSLYCDTGIQHQQQPVDNPPVVAQSVSMPAVTTGSPDIVFIPSCLFLLSQ